MKLLKNFSLLFTFMLSLFTLPNIALASSGKINVTSSATTVIVGNTVTVNVTLSSNEALGAWEFDINYDTSILKLTSSNAENNGTYFVNAGDGKQKSKTYTLKFRALKSGSTNITVGSYDVYAFDKSNMSITKGNKKLNLMTQAELEATYSKDNSLKSLSVEGYELDKTFNKDTLEYTVNVPTGTTSVKIKAVENDTKASVAGIGEIEVTEGLNTVTVVVTAQNGAEKTYTLTINVEDLNPISVTDIKGDTYTIVKNNKLLTAPETFMNSILTIDSLEVPAFRNNNADITLVGLKDNLGNIGLFVYENGKYRKYNEISLTKYLLKPVDFKEELDLEKTTVLINDEIFNAYTYSKNSDLVIISAQSLEDGKTNLYLYDPIAKTAIKYDDTYIKETNLILTNYNYIIIAFAGALFIMLILILCLLRSLRKKQKKIKKFITEFEAKIEATRKVNNVVIEENKALEEKNIEDMPKKEQIINDLENKVENKDNDDEVYDLFEEDRKWRKRKKN